MSTPLAVVLTSCVAAVMNATTVGGGKCGNALDSLPPQLTQRRNSIFAWCKVREKDLAAASGKLSLHELATGPVRNVSAQLGPAMHLKPSA